jgi:prolyl oligopeptidase
MHACLNAPPFSEQEPVTDVLHGVPVTDPYRWLENQESPHTRAWIKEQTRYARTYLDALPGRERIRERVRAFLAVETYDSLQKQGSRYFFRKRLPNQEQPCICMRDGADGEDQVLIDPAARGTGKFTAVKPLRVSPNGKLLLYEVKEGGERTGTFELLEIETRKRLSDRLPRGYLRGFAFTPNGRGFFYSQEVLDSERPMYRAAYEHLLGMPFDQDREIFYAGEDERIRLGLLSDATRLAFVVHRFLERKLTDIYFKPLEETGPPEPIFRGIDYGLSLSLLNDKILAITDRNAPNRRIVEIYLRANGEQEWVDIVPETDAPITNWSVVGDRILVSYMKNMTHRVFIFDFSGRKLGEIPTRSEETLRIISACPESEELLLETESFTAPVSVFRYFVERNERMLWATKSIPFDSANYGHTQIRYASKDGTSIPMFLVGRRDILAKGHNPTIMTSYGGYGVSMTPQFSVFVAFLMERGCLFALPNIRGGSEFGAEWHEAAKRRSRQTAYDDFLCAAEWLLSTGRTAPGKLAIFGGSNSGLLVGAALTQRPYLFRAVVCIAPLSLYALTCLVPGVQPCLQQQEAWPQMRSCIARPT